MTVRLLPAVNMARDYVARFYRPMVSQHQQGLVLEKDGEPIAACLYDHYNGRNVWMQVAGSPNRPWLLRGVLGFALRHAFVQLGCARITVMISQHNFASLRFCRRLGFQPEGRMVGAGPDGEDMLLFRLQREDCRYVST